MCMKIWIICVLGCLQEATKWDLPIQINPTDGSGGGACVCFFLNIKFKMVAIRWPSLTCEQTILEIF